MLSTFSGKTANDVWSQMLQELQSSYSIGSRNGNAKELLHATICIENPKERWLSVRVPPMSIGYALAELIWILKGSNDARIINYWNPILPQMAGQYCSYPGAYGYRILSNYGFNQLERVYKVLKNNPDSRQAIIQIWDPNKDTPAEDGSPANADIPCNICSLVKIRHGRLEWTQIMRSNDVLLGFPYNLIQFTCMQEILAGWLNVDIGSYIHYSDSLHLYEKDEDKAGMLKKNQYLNTDSLAVDKSIYCDVINEIYGFMEWVSNNPCTEESLLEISEPSQLLPEGYRNIKLIIAAYAAEKAQYYTVEENLVSRCTNGLYVHLWNSWRDYRRKMKKRKDAK